MKRNGGDPFFGRHQSGLFRKAGFEIVKVSATFDCWTSDGDATRRNASFLSGFCRKSEFSDQLREYGLADGQTLDQLGDAFLTWGNMPEAFAAEAWSEIVAVKPEGQLWPSLDLM